jgi:hypothetical protein
LPVPPAASLRSHASDLIQVAKKPGVTLKQHRVRHFVGTAECYFRCGRKGSGFTSCDVIQPSCPLHLMVRSRIEVMILYPVIGAFQIHCSATTRVACCGYRRSSPTLVREKSRLRQNIFKKGSSTVLAGWVVSWTGKRVKHVSSTVLVEWVVRRLISWFVCC